MSTEAELKKLTVPQLKALCKERRITGYSKLGKDVIIQKLLGIAPAAPAPSSSATAPILTETATPTPINSTDIHNSSASGPAVAPSHDPSLSNPASDSSIPVSTSKSRPKKQKNPTTSAVASKSIPVDGVNAQNSSSVQNSSSQPSTLTASSAEPPLPTPVSGSSTDAKSKPRPKKQKNPTASGVASASHPIVDNRVNVQKPSLIRNSSSQSQTLTEPPSTYPVPDSSTDPKSKPRPKKPKNSTASTVASSSSSAASTQAEDNSTVIPLHSSSQSTTLAVPSAEPPRPNPVPDSSTDVDSTSKPRPKKKKNTTASTTAPLSGAEAPARTEVHSANIQPSSSQPQVFPTLAAPSADPSPRNPAPDSSISSREESTSKPRPKKRKTPPASEDSLPASTSSHVFKVPAVPQRASTSGPDSGLPAATTAAAPKKKVATASSTFDPGSSPASSPLAPKKRKTVPADVPGPSTANAVADTIPAQTISARKPSKKTRPDVPTQPTVNTATHSAPAATTSRPPPVSKRSSTTLAPADPPAPKKRKIALSPAPKQPPVSKFVLPMKAPTAITPAAPTIPSIIAQEPVRLPEMRPKIPQKRFVPLVVTRKVPVPVPTAAAPLASIPVPLLATVPMLQPLYYLDFPTAPPPKSLSMIALPPKAVQRKRVVPRLSLVLSGVAEEDLFNCVLVSRTFRYAVYLSAFHRLTRYFAGERLSAVLKKHSETMTDMWPYLEQRTQELCGRKRQYSSSFLGRVFPPGSSSAISDRLWTSPDHERQTVVALRFLLTRLFFQVSVGGGKEGKGWTEGQIVDAQRLVNDEVWAITVRHSATSTECFYVLESTCEPLTTTTESPETGLPVRTDWAAYIAHRMTLPTDPPPPRLLDYLSWTNHEEYLLGISRLWLKRIEGEGEIGIAKRITAERYILACVVGNSLSGRWMSSTQMAQDFAGLADLAPARVKTSPKVNLFLPKHHHVESVHFTTSGSAKRPLHPALAVIQTPDREYFILRDNGMQVGCEEEGVAAAWMDIIGCENSGVATSA